MSDWDFFIASQIPPTSIPAGDTLEATYLIPLTQQGLIAINGPDCTKFLQGQVTCDVRELANQQTRLGAQCNIKGRMLLTFLALQTGSEQILLRIHKQLREQALANLGKYIVFSKAKLANASDDYRCIGITGKNAANTVEAIFSIRLTENNQWRSTANNIIIRIDEQRYECWLDAQQAEDYWLQLAQHCTIATDNLWALQNIQAGLGSIAPETYEAFTPQAINWQLVDGINFRKGCYTGQEIVARLHYRGTLKRHMYRFGFQSQELPIPNSPLLNGEGKVVGEVILSAWSNTGSGELLASVTDDEREAIYLANNPQKLELLSLPYAIPTADEAN